MLKYSQGESKDKSKLNIYSQDLQNIKSKALFTAVLLGFNERPTLLKMNIEKKTAVMVGIKSFIECFDAI